MRSRERLIEVLRSVNADVIGKDWFGVLHHAAFLLTAKIPNADTADLEMTIAFHHSPHVRELAGEAIHYLREDAHADQG